MKAQQAGFHVHDDLCAMMILKRSCQYNLPCDIYGMRMQCYIGIASAATGLLMLITGPLCIMSCTEYCVYEVSQPQPPGFTFHIQAAEAVLAPFSSHLLASDFLLYIAFHSPHMQFEDHPWKLVDHFLARLSSNTFSAVLHLCLSLGLPDILMSLLCSLRLLHAASRACAAGRPSIS